MRRECLLSVMLLCVNVSSTYCAGSDKGTSKTRNYEAPTNLSTYDSEIRRLLHKPKEPKGFVKEKAKKRGKSHYHAIVQDAIERRWAVPITLSWSLENRAFNNCGCKVSLSQSLFGEGTRIRDIFLLARLSDDNKLHIHPPIVPQNPQFGHYREQQYLALVAPTKIGMTATQQSASLGLSAMYRFKPVAGSRFFCIFGVDLPIYMQKRSIDLSFQDGTLFHFGYTANATIRENVLSQFFRDFTGIEDFFLRGVLGSKGIVFEPSQQKIGIGDLSVFTNFEFGPFYRESDCGDCRGLDFGQFGINIAFPTATKACRGALWEIEFGNGGSCLFTFFGSFNTRTGITYLNPTFNIGVEVGTRFCRGGTSGLRIPRTVVGAAEGRVIDNPDIITTVFEEYLTDAFQEQDTTVSIFADTAPDARIKPGRRIFFSLGNYFYNVFKTNFRLAVLYNFSSKKGDKVFVSDSSYDTSSLECPSRSHRFGWDLSYKFKNFAELGFGSQHILGGRNVPVQHEIFFSFSASF